MRRPGKTVFNCTHLKAEKAEEKAKQDSFKNGKGPMIGKPTDSVHPSDGLSLMKNIKMGKQQNIDIDDGG